MGEGSYDFLAALPPTIALFPLPNVVLFPGVPLPLHVFEPRYREMVRDVESSKERMIGMVLLSGDWQRDYYGRPPVFPVGCAGKLVSVESLADGRYNIVLHGVREFEIEREEPDGSYRTARVAWRAAGSTGLPADMRPRIGTLIRQYLEGRKSDLPAKLLADGSVPDEVFVNFLSYALDVPLLEKQALLEASPLAERGRRLCDVLQFAMQAGVARHGDPWTH